MSTIKLALNAGSSSIKFAISRGRRIYIRGQIEHFGRQARVTIIKNGRRQTNIAAVKDLPAGLIHLKKALTHHQIRPDAVVHRVVHGGIKFGQPARLDQPTLQYLNRLVPLAPLHQPANLLGVAWARRAWPRAAEWGVFDTAIYHAMPTVAKTYAIPRQIAKSLHIEKYGFHGISHDWAVRQAATQLRQPLNRLNAVTIHLGAGSSMTSWTRGKPVDTTMGFTPLAGLVMATRAGDIDPAIPLFLQEKLRWPASRVNHLLEFKSGLYGLCGLRDMRDVMDAAGHPVHGWPRHRYPAITKQRARLALSIYIYHLRLALAAYLGTQTKTAAMIFTGAIGMNRDIQKMVWSGLAAARGVRRLTIPADEEQAMINIIPS